MPPRKTPARSRAASPASEGGGDSLNAYIREIAKFHPLSGDDEKVLARRIQESRGTDQEALKRLVESNLRFVVSYAKRYRGLGLPFLDLIHEGNLGLIEAARRFDADRNVKFISYAVWWVRQAIFHALSEQSRVLRLPQKLSGQVSKMGAVRQRLAVDLERPPTTEEITAAMNEGLPEGSTAIEEKDVTRLLMVSGDDLSLSTAVGEEGSLELGDTLQQDSVPSVENELIRTSMEDRLHEHLANLDEKEQEVIKLRFGLGGDEPKTLQEIGEAMNLSRERIRQIESRAKGKLRRKLDEMAQKHRAKGLGSALN